MGLMGLRAKTLLSILMPLIWACAFLPAAQAQPASSEYQVKAAFIYNFAKFVEWPAEAMADNRPFVIGIVGQDPFGSLIDEAVAGKTIRDKKIVVKRFAKAEDAVDSHILFISGSEGANMPRVLKQIGRAPVLTVSDIERFAEDGGMVQLVMDQNRVRFAINVAVVERAGLKPSSQLLKLARIVPGGGANNGWPAGEFFSDRGAHHPLHTSHSAPPEKRAQF
jgi:hypothetical protein